VYSVAYSKNGKFIASGSYDKSIKLCGAETGEEEKTFLGHESYVNSVDFSPNGS
jgi:WD40 repeat protein